MANFTDEHKEETGKFFGEGVHKVKIMAVSSGTNDNGKEFIEFAVVGDNQEEGTARMWFSSDKAIRFSFNTVRSIFVHNALEGKKDAARDMVNKVKNTEELVDLCNKALIGKEAWYVVERSDYTYTNAAGEVKQGYNRNIYGYEPDSKPKAAAPESPLAGGTELDDSEVPDVF